MATEKDLQVIFNSGLLTNLYIGGTTADDKVLTKSEVDTIHTTPADLARLNPVSVAPTHIEGQFYYNSDSGTFNIQGPFPGIEVSPGHGEHLHVINNTGVTIPAGSAVRIAGVSAGIPQIVLALADSFANANVLGLTIIDVLDGAETAVAISGVIKFDTSLLTAGLPQYLSSTVAGALTTTAPAIRTEIGGVLVSSATVGQFRMDVKVNQNTPSVLGGLKGQNTPLYAVTTVVQDIIDYATARENVTQVDELTGEITLPNDGDYRVHFTADITFASATSTRTLYLELYDVTGTEIHYTYSKNIPRDAVEDSLSFNWTLDEIAGNVHKMRIRSSTAIAVTFSEISFDIESISIS